MQIHRKTEKPMVIHTKQKIRIHAKGKQETKIKGRNVLTVTRSPSLTGRERAQFVHNRTRADTVLPAKRNTAVISGRAGSVPGKSSCHGGTQKPVGTKWTEYSGISMAGAAGAKMVSEQTEGGSELYAACVTADMLTKPVRNAVHSVRRAEGSIKKASTASRMSVRKDASGLPVHNADIPVYRKTAECRQLEKAMRKTVNDFQQSFQLKKAATPYHIHNPSTMQLHKKETDIFSHNNVARPAVAGNPAQNSQQGISGKPDKRDIKKETDPSHNMSRPAATEGAATRNTGGAAATATRNTVMENGGIAVRDNPKKTAGKNTKNAVHKPARKVSGETVKKTARKASEETAKKVTKEAVKQSVKATASAAGTAAGTATTGVGGVLTGIAAGEAAGIRLDRHDMKVSTKKRMIQLYIAKLKQEKNRTAL